MKIKFNEETIDVQKGEKISEILKKKIEKNKYEEVGCKYNNEYKNQISDLASKCIQLTKEMNYNNQFTLLEKILSSSVLDGLNNNLSIYNEFLQNNDDIVNIDTKTNND